MRKATADPQPWFPSLEQVWKFGLNSKGGILAKGDFCLFICTVFELFENKGEHQMKLQFSGLHSPHQSVKTLKTLSAVSSSIVSGVLSPISFHLLWTSSSSAVVMHLHMDTQFSFRNK